MFKEIVCIIRSQIKFSTGKPLDNGRVAMIKEGTDFLIKGLNSLHVLIRKLKIEDIEVLFHPFLTTKAEGMGLGLAICRSIIEYHRGEMWFTRNPEGGSTFHFTVPAAA